MPPAAPDLLSHPPCLLQISEQMWSLWPQLIAAFHEWAVDYFENLLVPLDNFISRGDGPLPGRHQPQLPAAGEGGCTSIWMTPCHPHENMQWCHGACFKKQKMQLSQTETAEHVFADVVGSPDVGSAALRTGLLASKGIQPEAYSLLSMTPTCTIVPEDDCECTC